MFFSNYWSKSIIYKRHAKALKYLTASLFPHMTGVDVCELWKVKRTSHNPVLFAM